MQEIKITIPRNPITKKNSQRIVHIGYKCPVCKRGNRVVPLPSKAYETYEGIAGWYIRGDLRKLKINRPVNVKCIYWMEKDIDVDLANLLEATNDMLVKYGVLADDNRKIVASHDGSRVFLDRENPRVEITISFYQ